MKKFLYCCFIITLFVFMGRLAVYAENDKFSSKTYEVIRSKASEFEIDERVLKNICEDACSMAENIQGRVIPLYGCVEDYIVQLWLQNMKDEDAAKIKAAAKGLSLEKRCLSEYVNALSADKFSEFYDYLKKSCRLAMMEKWEYANKKADAMVKVAREQEREYVVVSSTFVPLPQIEEITTQFFEHFSEELLMKNFLFDRSFLSSLISEKTSDFLVSYYFMLRHPKMVSSTKVGEVDEVTDLVYKSMNIFAEEEMVVNLPEGPTLVVGDLHGNEGSAAKCVRIARSSLSSGKAKSVVFLGDYIDRGFHSLEVLKYLLRLKLQFPDKVFMLRGNHESDMAEPNTFVSELNKIFGLVTGHALCNIFYDDLFPLLPVAVKIPLANGKKVFCVHAGFPNPDCSEELDLFTQLKDLTTEEVSDRQEFNDIILSMTWNDPDRGDESKSCRGNFMFSQKQLEDFLDFVGCDYLVRGHEFMREGFAVEFDGKCCTVFSSANYYDSNQGTVVLVSDDGIKPIAKIFHRDIEFLDEFKDM